MFLHSWHPEPFVANIAGFGVHWYGLLLAIGALAGYWVASRLGRRYGITNDRITDLAFFLLLAGLIGARLYHVTNEWAFYSAHPGEIVKIWNGGLAIHGAVIAGIVVLWLFGRRTKTDPWLLADIIAPALALGQAIGRWGNYFNQELFGRPTSLPWGIPIDPIHRPLQYAQAAYFHPTFLYESLGSAVIVLILVWLHRQRTNQAPPWTWWRTSGTIALTYLAISSLLRIGTEVLRIDRVPVIAGVRLPLLSSIIIIILAAGVWMWRSRQHPEPHGTS